MGESNKLDVVDFVIKVLEELVVDMTKMIERLEKIVERAEDRGQTELLIRFHEPI